MIKKIAAWLERERYNRSDFCSIFQREIDPLCLVAYWGGTGLAMMFAINFQMSADYYEASGR